MAASPKVLRAQHHAIARLTFERAELYACARSMPMKDAA